MKEGLFSTDVHVGCFNFSLLQTVLQWTSLRMSGNSFEGMFLKVELLGQRNAHFVQNVDKSYLRCFNIFIGQLKIKIIPTPVVLFLFW